MEQRTCTRNDLDVLVTMYLRYTPDENGDAPEGSGNDIEGGERGEIDSYVCGNCSEYFEAEGKPWKAWARALEHVGHQEPPAPGVAAR